MRRTPKKHGADADDDSAVPEKSARLRSFVVEPVLDGDVLSESVPLEVFHIYEIADKRNIPKILKCIPALDESFSHLKRINGGFVLLGPSTSLQANEVLPKLKEVDGDEGQVELKEVPRIKPLTRRQFEWAKTQWPTAFHADKRLESILDGTFFGAREIERLQRLILRAERIQGCLVVDPAATEDDGVVAEGTAHSKNPLGHPVMEAVMKLADKHCTAKDSEQYLATGFDIFLHREPCAMCAMALVHCRANRVFFAEPQPKGGAFVSSWNLQHEPRINHHYEVYRLRESL